MNKFTPGPWQYLPQISISYNSLTGEKLERVLHFVETEKDGHVALCAGLDKENEADARLVASAPEMLDALKLALKVMKSYNLDNVDNPETRLSLAKGEDAIAKATGEE